MTTRSVALAVLALVVTVGCTDPTRETDAGPGDDAGSTEPCPSAVAAATFFATERCLECHSERGIFPDLRAEALAALVNEPSHRRPDRILVVPGRPDESELYLRLVGPKPASYPGSWFMPLGATAAHPAPGPIEAWIARDAELTCDAP